MEIKRELLGEFGMRPRRIPLEFTIIKRPIPKFPPLGIKISFALDLSIPFDLSILFTATAASKLVLHLVSDGGLVTFDPAAESALTFTKP